MSRLPKLTATLVVNEILVLHVESVAVEIYPLLLARRTEIHPEGDFW